MAFDAFIKTLSLGLIMDKIYFFAIDAFLKCFTYVFFRPFFLASFDIYFDHLPMVIK